MATFIPCDFYSLVKTIVLALITALFLPFSIWAASPKKSGEDLVHYDRGSKRGARVFQSARNCHTKPCVVSRYGAIRLSGEAQKNYTTALELVHQGEVKSISLFQAASKLDDKLSERLFYRRQNRKIFNLEEALNSGQTDVIYVYGIDLHHNIDEADVIALTLRHVKNPKDTRHFYFRHHHDGPDWDIDVAVMTPVKFFHPNPGKVVRGATASPAFSLTLGWYANPEKELTFMKKFLHAWKFNLASGVLVRRELVNRTVDQYVDTKFDAFFGGGLTLLDFVNVGYGINLIRTPRATFPYVGIEVRHAYEFIRSLRQSTNKKWRRYLKKQQET